jgi:hypothetical protein
MVFQPLLRTQKWPLGVLYGSGQVGQLPPPLQNESPVTDSDVAFKRIAHSSNLIAFIIGTSVLLKMGVK